MAFKTLFKSKEKMLSIRKELEPFADLLEKDRKGNPRPVLTKKAKGKLMDMYADAMYDQWDLHKGIVNGASKKMNTRRFKDMIMKDSNLGIVDIIEKGDKSKRKAIIWGSVLGALGMSVIMSTPFSFVTYFVAGTCAKGLLKQLIRHKANNANFVDQLKIVAPEIRESMGKG